MKISNDYCFCFVYNRANLFKKFFTTDKAVTE